MPVLLVTILQKDNHGGLDKPEEGLIGYTSSREPRIQHFFNNPAFSLKQETPGSITPPGVCFWTYYFAFVRSTGSS